MPTRRPCGPTGVTRSRPPPGRSLRGCCDATCTWKATPATRSASASVRAATDDDEVDLAYYFLDDALAASDRAAYVLLEDWRLPTALGTGGHGFDEPAGVQRLTADHGGTGTTYVVALRPGDLFDRRSLVPPSALVGVRLPELASCLRSVRLHRPRLALHPEHPALSGGTR